MPPTGLKSMLARRMASMPFDILRIVALQALIPLERKASRTPEGWDDMMIHIVRELLVRVAVIEEGGVSDTPLPRGEQGGEEQSTL